MGNSIKNRTMIAVFWSFAERFGSVIIQFVANIVLARLLLPSDFGLIGVIMVFISISNTFVDGGLGSALVQEKEATKIQYSTIFYINVFVAFLISVIIFYFSSAIALFYEESLLESLLKVLSLILIFNALSIIQNALLIKQIDFKRIAFINVFSTFISCVVSICAAVYGFGVWSLVIQLIGISFLRSMLLWLGSEWRPMFAVDFKSVKNLVNFGYKLLVSGLMDSLYNGVQTSIIGKLFGSTNLGYFTQAKKLQETPGYTLSAVVNQVTFPVFVLLKDDVNALKAGVKKSIVPMAYFNFPVMIMLILIAQPLFLILLTSKWNASVPYFQLLCFSGMFLTTHSVNLNILKSIGKTNTYLWSETLKKIVAIGLIAVGFQWGVIGIVYSIVISTFISFFINGYFSGKAINYGIQQQVEDLFPSFILSILIGVVVYYIFLQIDFNLYIKVIIELILYVLLYIGISKVFNVKGYETYNKIFNDLVLKKTNIKNKYLL